MDNAIAITIQSAKDTIKIDTNVYVLLYFIEGKIQATGTVELSLLAPLLLKIVSEKLSR